MSQLGNALFTVTQQNVLGLLYSQPEKSFYLSVASGNETTDSDIDLMVIGDAGFSEVVAALYATQDVLGREINSKIYSKEEWEQGNKPDLVK